MQNNSHSSSFVIRRLAAFLYDSLLLIALFFGVASIAIALNEGQATQNIGFYVVLYAVGFMFFTWFWRNGGQTLGMQAWRIKVVSDLGEKLTYQQCIKRYLCGSLLFGITLIAALLNKSGRGLHDTLSNTSIVFKNKDL